MTTIADATDSSTVAQLIATIEDLRDTVEQQTDRINELESELTDCRAENEHDKAQIRQKITNVENQTMDTSSGDVTSEEKADNKGSQTTETPLERICALPEHVADRELTANQERARFIARDVRDYAEKAPAGLVIDSRAIKRVLVRRLIAFGLVSVYSCWRNCSCLLHLTSPHPVMRYNSRRRDMN